MGQRQMVKKNEKHLSYLEPKNLRNRSINDQVMAKSHFSDIFCMRFWKFVAFGGHFVANLVPPLVLNKMYF